MIIIPNDHYSEYCFKPRSVRRNGTDIRLWESMDYRYKIFITMDMSNKYLSSFRFSFNGNNIDVRPGPVLGFFPNRLGVGETPICLGIFSFVIETPF